MTQGRRAGLLAAALAGVALLTGGCAERGLAARPPTPPGPGTWVAVGTAATLATVVLAAVLVLPGVRRGGSGFAAGFLALQAGAAVVGGAVLIGAAVRSGQLVTREAGAEQAASLVQLTGLDGRDSGFFPLMVAVIAVLGLLLVVLLVLTARFAAGADPVERTLACCVLALEALVAAVAVVLGLLGHRSLPFALTAAAFPPLVLALITCWPHDEAEGGQLGYNGGHG